MNLVVPIAEPRVVPFQATSYAAFKVCEGRTYALGELDAGSLPEAMNEAVASFALHHKEHLLLRETGQGGVKLHLFSIRKKANARYVHTNHVTRAVHDLYAAPVCTVDGGILFQPAEEPSRGNNRGGHIR